MAHMRHHHRFSCRSEHEETRLSPSDPASLDGGGMDLEEGHSLVQRAQNVHRTIVLFRKAIQSFSFTFPGDRDRPRRTTKRDKRGKSGRSKLAIRKGALGSLPLGKISVCEAVHPFGSTTNASNSYGGMVFWPQFVGENARPRRRHFLNFSRQLLAHSGSSPLRPPFTFHHKMRTSTQSVSPGISV